MDIKFVTLFPKMFEGFINESIIKRAIDKGVVNISTIDFREYSHDKHHHVDDTPYGGGAGMVLRCDIIDECLNDIKTKESHIVLLTPQGKTFNQDKAFDLSKYKDLIFVCGHYEGFDERIRGYVDEEISIGDFVLTGGEIPAMAISDSIIRILDGAITKESYLNDSFQNGLLEHPQYTRPETYKGESVPEVLQNGNHALINRWRLKESLRKTYLNRPDLLENRKLSKEEEELLKEIKEEL
jgi:tRNA (guanine37-N1)-methyltransferase